MGFLELIPADQLAASYDGQYLILYAQGQVQDSTTGITFNRQPWMGGLKFDLEGWVGPLTGTHSKYKHEQKFKIHLPNPVYPSGDVIIVDQNNPKGKVVPIHWLGEKIDGANTKPASLEAGQGAGAPPAEPQFLLPEDVHLTEVVNKPFQVKESADASNFGTINIKFDTDFLVLKNAGIEGKNIFWAFDPVKTGKTQVLVTIYGGITPVVLRRAYDINILPGLNGTDA